MFITLVKNNGHLLVSNFFTFCVYSCPISQMSGYQCRKNNWDIINGIQFQCPLGSIIGQGGIALIMWKKRCEGEEVKAAPWDNLPSLAPAVLI